MFVIVFLELAGLVGNEFVAMDFPRTGPNEDLVSPDVHTLNVEF